MKRAMYKILYVSLAIRPLSPDETQCLLEDARKRNYSLNVTGLLAYDQEAQSFFQILEGAEADVTAIYDLIKSDKRHKDLRILEEGPCPRRRFGEWSMELVDSAYFKAIVFENL